MGEFSFQPGLFKFLFRQSQESQDDLFQIPRYPKYSQMMLAQPPSGRLLQTGEELHPDQSAREPSFGWASQAKHSKRTRGFCVKMKKHGKARFQTLTLW